MQVRFAFTALGRELADKGIDVTPRRTHDDDACFDLFAAHTPVGYMEPIACGILVEVPEGFEGLVRGRSGLAQRGFHIHHGTIDAGYRGEVRVLPLAWPTGYVVKVGDRIAQLAIRPIPLVSFVEVDESALTKTGRGAGGFGSTGR